MVSSSWGSQGPLRRDEKCSACSPRECADYRNPGASQQIPGPVARVSEQSGCLAKRLSSVWRLAGNCNTSGSSPLSWPGPLPSGTQPLVL